MLNPELKKRLPQNLVKGKAFSYANPHKMPYAAVEDLLDLIVPERDVLEAGERLSRLAPLIERIFPETKATNGLIESELRELPKLKQALEDKFSAKIPGRLFMKLDSHLPIAGSVKARGGIYEVLYFAETLALQEGIISEDEARERLADPDLRAFFSEYKIQVGSTGNLGMSIGLMAAALGFEAIIHMSADAQGWKKELLRSRGVTVKEYEQDYSAAVAAGRAESAQDSKSYFVDDERSRQLFLGYTVAGDRLKADLDQAKIQVDRRHPLFVYLPAGVGSAPGGIAYRLKQLYKDAVHIFFMETCPCPSLLLGMLTGAHEQVRVQDADLSGQTLADGLACASPSPFVSRLLRPLLSGFCTVEDKELTPLLKLLYENEQIFIEPSSCVALEGPARLLHEDSFRQYLIQEGVTEADLRHSNHILWSTGGALVPDQIREDLLR